MGACRLELRGVTQRFPGVCALDGVDFDLAAGEIHALMGENGAGKSTLIKVACGVHRPAAGEIRLEGRRITPRSPREAGRLGISAVFQEIDLVPNLSVAENIVLGRQPRRYGLIDWRAARERARTALDRLGILVDPDRTLGELPIASQQLVAIARALDVRARVLILDEPTASLDRDEVEELFAVLRRLRDAGLAILFITHFLEQVFAVSDRVTVLRNGRWVGTRETADLGRAELVAMMVGREIPAGSSPKGGARAERAEGRGEFLAARALRRRGSIEDFEGAVGRGEIVGLAGLLGSGRTEVVRMLFGLDHPDGGEIRVDGTVVPITSPRRAVSLGFAFTPEDRKAEGIVPGLGVRENIILALQARQGPWRRIARSQEGAIADELIRALDIKIAEPAQPAESLSGGNQQKVILARWLALQPRLFLLDEPTRGIDIGAKQEIFSLMARLRDEGAAVLFVSAELEEIVRCCDRVLVLRDHRSAGEIGGRELDEAAILSRIAEAHDGA